jgi:hypothetical protein
MGSAVVPRREARCDGLTAREQGEESLRGSGGRGSASAVKQSMLWCGPRPVPRRSLVSDDNPLDHLPDPAKRFKVLAYTSGPEIYIEIMDDATKSGVVMPFLDAGWAG